MAEVIPTSREKSMQTAGVIAGVALACNALFYLFSQFYYSGNVVGDANAVRLAFAILSAVIAIAAYVAALSPRLIGHALALAIGIATLLGAVAALAKGLPPVMAATMLIIGSLIPVLAWKSWNHSRAAWAFLIAVVVVFGNVTFFGAPKVRHVLGIGLWYALIIPGLKAVCVIALAMVRDEYRE